MTKKLLLGLGTLTAVAAPVASVVACGSKEVEEENKYKINVTTPESKGHHTVTYNLALPVPANTDALTWATALLNSMNGVDMSFINPPSFDTTDINSTMQSVIDWLYSIGTITQQVSVSIEGDATTPSVVTSDFDFVGLIDIKELNAVDSEIKAQTFINNLMAKFQPFILKISNYYEKLFTDSTFTKWIAGLDAAGIDKTTIVILTKKDGTTITAASTAADVKAFFATLKPEDLQTS